MTGKAVITSTLTGAGTVAVPFTLPPGWLPSPALA